MKVIAFNGSARKDGNTAKLIRYTFEELENEGIETELLQLAGSRIQGCIACYKCFANKDCRCVVNNDIANECLEKMHNADGIIIGSPTYFAGITPEAKALIDRCGMVARANGDILKRKVGAGVVAARRGGAIHVFDTINHFFTISQMIVVGSSYWNIGVGRNIGDVDADEEGLKTMRDLGVNMAWLLKKLDGQ